METLRKLSRLSGRDVRLLLGAGLALAVVRAGLLVLPYRTMHGLASRDVLPPTSAASSPDRTVWAVVAVARRLPGASCLVQALAALWLLGRQGHPARLCLGVRRGKGHAFEAHAWLEQGDRVLLGGPVDDYSRLSVGMAAEGQSAVGG